MFDSPNDNPARLPRDVADEAVDLRTRGKTLSQIAYRLDFCCSDVAHDAILLQLDQRLLDPIGDLRCALAATPDERQTTVWPEAIDLYPKLSAVKECLDLVDARARLLELYPKAPRLSTTSWAPPCRANPLFVDNASRDLP